VGLRRFVSGARHHRLQKNSMEPAGQGFRHRDASLSRAQTDPRPETVPPFQIHRPEWYLHAFRLLRSAHKRKARDETAFLPCFSCPVAPSRKMLLRLPRQRRDEATGPSDVRCREPAACVNPPGQACRRSACERNPVDRRSSPQTESSQVQASGKSGTGDPR
jgi:hypothetical protein